MITHVEDWLGLLCDICEMAPIIYFDKYKYKYVFLKYILYLFIGVSRRHYYYKRYIVEKQ